MEKDGNGVRYSIREMFDRIDERLDRIETSVNEFREFRRMLKIGAAFTAFLIAAVLVPLFAAGKI